MAETTLHAKSSELSQFAALREQVESILHGPGPLFVVGPDHERIELPRSALDALKIVINALARGEAVTLVPHHKDLTSQEAADMLHVSRPHLIKLLDRGEIPFHRVGTHRRIKLEDALSYEGRRDAARQAALDELARLSEELPGGYR